VSLFTIIVPTSSRRPMATPSSTRQRGPALRRRSALAAAIALSAGTLAIIGATEAHAASSCSVQYTVASSWPTGATVAINITNNGPATTSWKLTFAFPGSQQVSNGWNGTYTQSGQNVSVASESYNGSLATGASTSTGFNLSYSGSNPSPTAFSLN